MYRLTRGAEKLPTPPVLDPSQRAVVEHAGGPLLVLAGPGTGKTTTLVECVVDRIERRGATPDSILVLTFSRKAAADLRARIASRLGRTTVTPMAMTFHAFCYALVRRFADEVGVESNDLGAPLRLLTGPEQEFRVRETLQGSLETQRVQWPTSLARAFPTRAFAAEVRAVLAKARQLGMDPDDVVAAGQATGREEWVSVGAFFDEYLDVLDAEGVLDYAELVHRCRILLTRPEIVAALRRGIGCVFVDEYQDTDPSQVRLLQVIAGDGRDVIVVGDPDQSIYAFRGAEARGILDFPELFRARDGSLAPVVALNRTRRFGSALLTASRNVVSRLGLPRSLPVEVFDAFRHPTADPERPKGKVEIFTCSSSGAEAEHIADILRSAHLRDNLAWTDMAVLVRAGRTMIPGLTRALVDYLDAVGVERATFVGNSLGCPIVTEVAATFPERIDAAVLVSPAGGVNNRPMVRALGQMALVGTREPPAMLRIAVRDYLRFGIVRSLALFRAMMRYPTLERLQDMTIPTLVVTGDRDPLVDQRRVFVLGGMPQVEAMRIPGAHALNFSRPAIVADLTDAFVSRRSLDEVAARHRDVERISIPRAAVD